VNVLDHLAKAIEAKRVKLLEKCAMGAADWPDYNRLKGNVQGLDTVLGEIHELKQKLQRDGDLDSEE
jgi:hypothetical protein